MWSNLIYQFLLLFPELLKFSSQSYNQQFWQWWYLKFQVDMRIHYELDGFPVLKGFSEEIGDDISNVTFWYCIAKSSFEKST
jgi:hypothetical protein